MQVNNQNNATESFGARLRRLRMLRHFSVKEMAALLNVSISTYRDWENGRAIQGEPCFGS